MKLTVIESLKSDVFVLTGQEHSPMDIDFDLLGLHKKRSFEKGELKTVEYFLFFDEQTDTHSGLAVRETNTYIRKNDFVYKREKKIEWFAHSGHIGAEKNTVKYYESIEAIAEGKTRRSNIIDDVKHKVWKKFTPTDAFGILSVFKPQIDLYIEGVLQPLYEALSQSEEPYLNNPWPETQISVRAFLLDFVTI